MEKLDISATRSTNLHLHSSFSSVHLCIVSHGKSHLFTTCSAFLLLPSQGFLKLSPLSLLRPETPSLFPASSPLGKKQANPYSMIFHSWNLPETSHLILASIPFLCIFLKQTSGRSCVYPVAPLCLPPFTHEPTFSGLYGMVTKRCSCQDQVAKYWGLSTSVSILCGSRKCSSSQLLRMHFSSETVHSLAFHSHLSLGFFLVSLVGSPFSHSLNTGPLLWPFSFYAVLSLRISSIPSDKIDNSHI